MIYIKKMKPLSVTAEELRRVIKESDWDNIDKSKVDLVRSIFDSLDKGKIRESLVRVGVPPVLRNRSKTCGIRSRNSGTIWIRSQHFMSHIKRV